MSILGNPVLTAAALSSTFTPAVLFTGGVQGVWYDPSDFSTMFQDSAGTTPVTATGQPVGLMQDKSGNGYHASQATPASRPVLNVDGNGKYYLLFDGVDDSLATGTISPGNVDKVQVFAGVRKLSDASFPMIAEYSATVNTNNGSFNLNIPGAGYTFSSKGSVLAQANIGVGYASPITNVVTELGDIIGDLATLRVNGTQVAQVTTDQGTGNFGSYPLYIGRRGGASLPFNGQLYSLIARFSSSNLDVVSISKMETWVNGKTGAY